MSLIAMPQIQLIIPEGDLQSSVQSELIDNYNIKASISLAEYLTSVGNENAALIICAQLILGNKEEEVLATIKANSPNSRILITGLDCASSEQVKLLKHGARGYFDTSVSLGKLNEAVQCILHGEVWIERHVISGLIDELSHVPLISEAHKEAVATLSPKELEVAKLVSHGATNKMIAKDMAITERTVKAHLTAVFQKMDLADRLSLAIFFRDLRG